MNTGPSLEGSEFMPDNEDVLNAHVESVGDDINTARKRRIDDVEESPDQQLEQGIYLHITVRSLSPSKKY